MFVGRKREAEIISNTLKKTGVAVLVYGKRKVGKTTLITETLKSGADTTLYYECLRSTLRDNIEGFVSVLVAEGVLPVRVGFASFQDIFAYLNSLNKTFNVVIDEYPYLKQFERSETVDSIFQSIIDNNISNLRIFLSGSHVGVMSALLQEGNALYGRFAAVIKLDELNYIESAEFYSQRSVYDKAALYAVFGGSPFICGFIDGDKSLKQNILDTVLNETSAVYNYAEHLLISDFSGSINAERILSAIANGRKKYGMIESTLGMQNNGLLSKHLKSLLDMGILKKVNPINKLNDKKKTVYEISDNILRFYYTYIYGNKSALLSLGAETFYDSYIAPSILTFVSHRFEDICREYFSLRAKRGELKNVYNIGTYYYDDAESKSNGEFDIAIQRESSYDIYEVKYCSSPLSLKDMQKEAAQISEIKGLTVGHIGFVSVTGFETVPDGFDCVTGDMLYDL